MQNTQQVSLSLTTAVVNKLEDYQMRTGLSRSKLVTILLEAAFRLMEKDAGDK